MRPTHIVPKDLYQTGHHKTAMGNNFLKVGPRADRWVEEVIQRLQEEHPYVAQYAIQGKLLQSDAEKLYGIGYVEVRTPTESRFKGPAAKIPFVIENGLLHPLKVFVDDEGKHDLLDKDIFAEAMFSSPVSLSMSERGEDPSLTGSLYPPDRTRFGLGGQGSFKESAVQPDSDKKAAFHNLSDGPWLGTDAERLLKESGVVLSRAEREAIHKTAMVRLEEKPGSISILDKVAHTITKSAQKKVAQTIVDGGLQNHFLYNGFSGLVQHALAVEPLAKKASYASDVVQVVRLGGGKYQIKRANVDGFAPSTDTVSAVDASALVGDDLVGTLDAQGRVTMTTQPAIQETLEDVQVEPINDYGIFKVQDLDSGKHMIGWCITNVIDFYMNSSSLKLFTTGSQYALQEQIAGVRVAMGTALPKAVPEAGRTGVFFFTNGSGRATCTLPFTITHTEDNGGTQYLVGIDLWGTPMRVTYAPGLKAIIDMGEQGFAIPDTMSWMPLDDEIRLVPDTMLFSKLASADQQMYVNIIGSTGSFSFRGPAVEKLASSDKHFLSEEDAEFALVAMGASPTLAIHKMAEACVHGESTLRGVRPLVSKAYKEAHIKMAAARIREDSSAKLLVTDTVKMAAMLPPMTNPQSVDAVLSLNFINPDNLMLFIESLPHLEQARKDLAELYLAASLGLPDVPSTGIIRAAEALRDVTNGLRKLRMRAMLV